MGFRNDYNSTPIYLVYSPIVELMDIIIYYYNKQVIIFSLDILGLLEISFARIFILNFEEFHPF